jgi:ankyrin repeat protein
MAGPSALLAAVAAGDDGEVARMLDAGLSIETKDVRAAHSQAFALLIHCTCLLLGLLILHRSKLRPQENGDTLLANAAFNGHYSTAALLVKRGADVNAANRYDGDTVLMWAAVGGQIDICELLLRNGAEVNAENKKGYRALYRAAYKDHARIVRMLLVAGAEPRAVTKSNMSAWDLANELRFPNVIESLKLWSGLDGQEAFKSEFPDVASNFVASNFVSGKDLLARGGARASY